MKIISNNPIIVANGKKGALRKYLNAEGDNYSNTLGEFFKHPFSYKKFKASQTAGSSSGSSTGSSYDPNNATTDSSVSIPLAPNSPASPTPFLPTPTGDAIDTNAGNTVLLNQVAGDKSLTFMQKMQALVGQGYLTSAKSLAQAILKKGGKQPSTKEMVDADQYAKDKGGMSTTTKVLIAGAALIGLGLIIFLVKKK